MVSWKSREEKGGEKNGRNYDHFVMETMKAERDRSYPQLMSSKTNSGTLPSQRPRSLYYIICLADKMWRKVGSQETLPSVIFRMPSCVVGLRGGI